MIFDPFGDFETAGYLQNSLKLKDPLEVKESEHLSFEASIEDERLSRAGHGRADRTAEWHR